LNGRRKGGHPCSWFFPGRGKEKGKGHRKRPVNLAVCRRGVKLRKFKFKKKVAPKIAREWESTATRVSTRKLRVRTAKRIEGKGTDITEEKHFA